MPSKPSLTPSSSVVSAPREPSMSASAEVLERSNSNSPKALDEQALMAELSSAGPTLEPPAATSTGGITGIWIGDKKVNALWTNSSNRNTWFGVAGVGWKKFADNSDSAAMAFSLLAANARITQGNASYREEADGKVYEMYVW